MFYTLQITAEIDANRPAAIHRPISVETFAGGKKDVTEEEIELVADAFKRQIKGLLTEMVKSVS